MTSTNRAMTVSEVTLPSWYGHQPEDEFKAFVLGLFSDDEFVPIRSENQNDKRDEVDRVDGINLRFMHIRSGNEILVRCHYQKDAVNKVEWCSKDELEELRRFQDSVLSSRLFVVIGLGGEVDQPKHLFCVPIKHAKWSSMYIPVLRLFEHDAQEPLRFENKVLI